MSGKRIDAWNIEDLRQMARRRLPKGVFEFVDRGAEDEVTLARNRAAFEAIRFRQRVLRDVGRRNVAIDLLGQRQKMPAVIAPTAAGGLLWHRGDVALARAAARMDIPFAITGEAMIGIEDLRRAAPDTRLWLQIYLRADRDMAWALVDRARELGYEALILTVDTETTPNREYMAHNGFSLPFRLNARNTFDTLRHPRWLLGVVGKYMANGGLPGFANQPGGEKSSLFQGNRARQGSSSATWEDLKHLRERWPRKLLVKGVLDARDAAQAVETGANGIVISNHGGRNLDGAPATIEVLPEIAQAVAKRAAILLDSGVRRGADIVKALALGADAVMLGRATLYGLAAAGQPGAERSLTLLRSETDRVLGLLGCADVNDLGPEHVWR